MVPCQVWLRSCSRDDRLRECLFLTAFSRQYAVDGGTCNARRQTHADSDVSSGHRYQDMAANWLSNGVTTNMSGMKPTSGCGLCTLASSRVIPGADCLVVGISSAENPAALLGR